MVHISIEYDKEVYSPGDKVSVRILINVVGTPKKICSIRISLIGGAYVSWYENHDKWVKHYTSEHTYITDVNYLLLNRPEENTFILPVGEHAYDYDFILPDSCDSSYRKSYGKIKYECKVEIERAFPSRDIKYVKKLNVYRPVLLSEEWGLPSPVTETIESHFLAFEKGSITVNGNVPKSCYLPGETINLEASLLNRSPRTITSMEIRLVEATTYTAFFKSFYTSEHKRTKRNRLVDLKENLQIEAGSDFSKSQDIKIPQFTPIHNNCPYIIVNYYIKVSKTNVFNVMLISLCRFLQKHYLELPHQ
ncbi:hypothetical protein PRIPAC_71735 [Pristionchus pacificus]|nr:hypothetical protein PRIPAC_71735 [Pristionchus pacificus]